jgi:hypothetical protein
MAQALLRACEHTIEPEDELSYAVGQEVIANVPDIGTGMPIPRVVTIRARAWDEFLEDYLYCATIQDSFGRATSRQYRFFLILEGEIQRPRATVGDYVVVLKADMSSDGLEITARVTSVSVDTDKMKYEYKFAVEEDNAW